MFTHISKDNHGSMVNISDKCINRRSATAQTRIKLTEEIMCHFDGKEIQSKKGPIFNTAIIAGTLAVKKTHELIPFCHQLMLDSIIIKINCLDRIELLVECTVFCEGKTGVEMEALTGVSVAALTIYDMCKSFSHKIEISSTKLIKKTGGESQYIKYQDL